MSRVERDILGGEGYACVLPVCDPQGERFVSLFSRASEYASLRAEADAQLIQVTPETALSLTRQARKLRKAYAQLTEIDFFPDAAQQQADARLREPELAISRALSRDEPSSQHRRWSSCRCTSSRTHMGHPLPTLGRPLASARLIRRFIDPAARILWLPTPEACPSEALGFDFDGARFSHVGDRVTFETIQASFLAAPGLDRVAAVVHYLDIGGTQPAEAAGVERVLAGLRASLESDDELTPPAQSSMDCWRPLPWKRRPMNDNSMQPDSAKPRSEPVSFRQALLFWLKLGFISLAARPADRDHASGVGGAASLDLRTALSPRTQLHAAAGPEAQQLATYIGWLRTAAGAESSPVRCSYCRRC